MVFKIGDEVEWTSQARGSMKTKRGEIFAIVPAGQRPRLQDLSGTRRNGMGGGLPRSHESYLVRVRRAHASAAMDRAYWPRVSQLRPVTARQHEDVEIKPKDKLRHEDLSAEDRRGKVALEEGNPEEEGWRCLGWCTACGRSLVDVAAGMDTCDDCIAAA